MLATARPPIPRPAAAPRGLRGAFGTLRRETWLCLALALALANLFPYFPDLHSANELSRLYLADALAEGHIDIDPQIKRWGNVGDTARREGKLLSDKAPGLSFTVLPAIWVYRHIVDRPSLTEEMRIARVFGAHLPALAALLVLAALLRRLTRQRRVRAALLVATGLGSLLCTYGVLLFGHALSAALGITTFWLLTQLPENARVEQARRRRGSRSAEVTGFGVGLCAGWAVVTGYQNAVFLFPLGVLFLVKLARRGRRWFLPTLAWRPLLGAVLGLAGPGLLLAAYHTAAFGGPLTTGYEFLTHQKFAKVHAQGLMGLSTPTIDHFELSLFLSEKGLFFFAPYLVFALPALLWWPRSDGRGPGFSRAERWTLKSLVGVQVLFVSSMVYAYGGWTVSQRHLTPTVPVLVLMAGALVARWPLLRGPFAAAAALSVGITFGATATWPYLFEELANPAFQLTWDLVLDGWFARTAFGYLGVPSALSFVIVIGLAGWALLRPVLALRGWRRALALCALLYVPTHAAAMLYLMPTTDWVHKRRLRVERDFELHDGQEPVSMVTARGSVEAEAARAANASNTLAGSADGKKLRCERKPRYGRRYCRPGRKRYVTEPLLRSVGGAPRPCLVAFVPAKGHLKMTVREPAEVHIARADGDSRPVTHRSAPVPAGAFVRVGDARQAPVSLRLENPGPRTAEVCVLLGPATAEARARPVPTRPGWWPWRRSDKRSRR